MTYWWADSIVTAFANTDETIPMAATQFQALEQKIDDLISLCADLNRENASLKTTAAGWQQERQQLMERNQLARNKVEAMISRLKQMEQDS